MLRNLSLVFLLWAFTLTKLAAQNPLSPGSSPQKVSREISVETLKNASVPENLIEGFPAKEMEIISCHIKLSGKAIEPGEWTYSSDSANMTSRIFPGIFMNTGPGDLIQVDFIKVRSRNNKDGPVSFYAPRQLKVKE
jgi:hypothetical protein